MSSFIRQNMVVFFLLNTGNVFNYLFQMMLGRVLTPEDFGAFNALNSLGAILTTSLGVLPLVLSRFTVEFSLEGGNKVSGLLRAGLRHFTVLGLGFFVLSLAALPFIKSFLNLDASTPVVLVLAFAAVCLVLTVPLGVLQGLQRFTGWALTFNSVVSLRFFSAWLFVVLLGWTVNGAVLCLAVAALLSVFLGLLFLKDVAKAEPEPLPTGTYPKMVRYAVPVFMTSMLTLAMGNLDLILVRHFCSPLETGYYATAAVLGRIAYFLPSVLPMVLFPAAAKAMAKGERDTGSLLITLGLTALAGGGFALVACLWPEFLIRVLFGAKYLDAAGLFRLVATAMVLLAGGNVFFTYCLARRRYGFLWIMAAGVVALVGLVYALDKTAMTVAWILLGTNIGVLGLTGAWFWLGRDSGNGNRPGEARA